MHDGGGGRDQMLAFTFSSARRLGWSSLLGGPVRLFSIEMLPYCSWRARSVFLFFFFLYYGCLTCWWLDDKVGSSTVAALYYMQMFGSG